MVYQIFSNRCTECGKVYQAMHGLKGHMKQAHTEEIEKECFICDVCKKTFTSKVGLKRHLQWHSETTTKTDDDQYKKFIAGIIFGLNFNLLIVID